MNPSDSSDLWNSTTLDPASVTSENKDNEALNKALQDQNSATDSALAQYYQIRERYNEMLSEAVKTQDPTKRAKLISTITEMNQQLSTIVASIQQMYTSGKSTLGQMPPINFAEDLNQFKRDLSMLFTEKDEVSKLNTVYSTLAGAGGGGSSSSYYIYIIAILGMLVLLLVMFTFTSLMTNVQSAVSSVPSMSLPELPAIPSVPSSGLTSAT
jgi:Rad3-related DNA helicase